MNITDVQKWSATLWSLSNETTMKKIWGHIGWNVNVIANSNETNKKIYANYFIDMNGNDHFIDVL
jgi:hypothetical protein